MTRADSETPVLPLLGHYVRDRLRRECQVRGTQAEIARLTHISDAHLANIRKGVVGVGTEVGEKLARHWGMSFEELLAAARAHAATNPPVATPPTSPAGATLPLGQQPEWVEAFARARQIYPGVPLEWLERAREAVLPGVRVTADDIGWVGRRLWLTHLEEEAQGRATDATAPYREQADKKKTGARSKIPPPGTAAPFASQKPQKR